MDSPLWRTILDGLFWVLVSIGLMIGFWAAFVQANPFVCDDAANTCTYRATVTEPTKKVGGLALDNLKQTNIKAQLNGGAFTTTIKPATAATGGGTVAQDFTFATTPCAVTTFSAKASATNTANVEGPETPVQSVQRDRTADPTCAPAAPGLVLN
jgi:hypothetical protein